MVLRPKQNISNEQMYNSLKEKLTQCPYSSALQSLLWILTQTLTQKEEDVLDMLSL